VFLHFFFLLTTAMGSAMKILLAAGALYLCLVSADASLAKIASVASSVVEQNVPERVIASIYGNGRQVSRRYKREVIAKTLPDPKDCIRDCRVNETNMIMTATMKNVAKLISIALDGVTGDEMSTPAKEAQFKKDVEAKTVANMGPFFQDLCVASKKADDCYTQCPVSQLRDITTADHDTTEVFCEPGKNWNNFTEYWNAINCTNATEVEKPCDSKCGVDKTIGNVTHLDVDKSDNGLFDDDSDETGSEKKDKKADGSKIEYESDVKKNTAAVGPACKTTACQIDCYKPIMTQQCGAKAYDLYARMSKLEPRTSLRVLKLLNAVEPTDECKLFQ